MEWGLSGWPKDNFYSLQNGIVKEAFHIDVVIYFMVRLVLVKLVLLQL